jgi:hypothetical protein
MSPVVDTLGRQFLGFEKKTQLTRRVKFFSDRVDKDSLGVARVNLS